MKLLPFLLLLLAPLSHALTFPQLSPRSRVIRDPAERARLARLHDSVLEAERRGDIVSAFAPEEGSSTHEKRILPVVGLAGLAVIETAGLAGRIGGGVLRRLHTLLGGDTDTIWDRKEVCRVQYQTQGGGNCKVKSYKSGSVDVVGDHDWPGCGWNDPEKTTPPIEFFESDDGLGKYSVRYVWSLLAAFMKLTRGSPPFSLQVQFTATDKVAWSGTKDTKKCPMEGICHPQFIFYREDYNIMLNTWKSQGSISACQYSDGKDCRGLCLDGVKNQFSKGGNVWGGKCAIPCADNIKLSDP
ncbi:hypothetical protein F4810DRAFT_720623 [Camillea tinctor]|nr:hypothetical protein F4810DRAFT_720623 [Camillea tinctor]